MTTTQPDPNDRALALIAPPEVAVGALVVGFSGGLDSSVLLHRLAQAPDLRARGLRALHVHHGLHRDADAWAAHCEQVCATLAVPLRIERVQVPRRGGSGPEAAARTARHAAFAAALGDGDVLALAHHRDDQAETFLLRALRASGVDGLAAMRAWRRFGRGWLWRPLLHAPRARLHAYARAQRLRWIEDDSNDDPALDRNYLRKHVLPLLQARWPQASDAFARAAGLCAEAAELLDDGDAAALAAAATPDPHCLSVPALQALPAARRARALRRWLAALGLPPLPAAGSAHLEHDLLASGDDTQAEFAWAGAVVRRWRDVLHADFARPPLPPDYRASWDGRTPLPLPTGDVLALLPADATAGAAAGAAEAATDAAPPASTPPDVAWPLTVHARRGGERIVLPGRAHSHALKHALQDAGVPPWERARLPLLSDAQGRLLAAGDRLLSAPFDAWLRARQLRLHRHGGADANPQPTAGAASVD